MGETTWEEHCPDCGKINVRSQSAHDAGLGAYCLGLRWLSLLLL
jgi:hypothetical protein